MITVLLKYCEHLLAAVFLFDSIGEPALFEIMSMLRYSNIDDWEGTLMLTRLGLKYREYDFQQSEKAFEEEMRRQLGGNDNGKLQ